MIRPLLLCLFLSDLLCGQAYQLEGVDGRRISKSQFEAKLDSSLQALQIPALSVALINQRTIVYQRTFINDSDSQAQAPYIFEAASLSKPLFAYWFMQQVEAGKMSLEKPLVDYIPHPNIHPADSQRYRSLNAAMVLAHQSGFPNHAEGKAIQLKFAPGEGFQYSGEAYQYLAMACAAQLGLDSLWQLDSLIRRDIFDPLGMSQSSYLWQDHYYQHKLLGHDKDLKPQHRNPEQGFWGPQDFKAYASLHSNAAEYALFAQQVLNRQGLNESSYDQMFAEHTHFNQDNPLYQQIGQTGWGLGFAQKREDQFTRHFHTGNNHQFQSFVLVIPETGYGLVLFTNCGKMIPVIAALSTILGPQIN